MTPKQAGSLLQRRVNRLVPNLVAAEEESIHDMEDEAIDLSSGTLTPAEKKALDYPYAKRHGGALVPGDPAIINVVTDTFRSRWRTAVSRIFSGTIYNALINDDPKAYELVHGSRVTIPRPIDERIVERTQFDRVRRIYQAIRRTFQ